MAVVLYREKVSKVIRVKRVITKVRVNALPFMTFYDAFALWHSTMKKVKKGHKGQKGKNRG